MPSVRVASRREAEVSRSSVAERELGAGGRNSRVKSRNWDNLFFGVP
ncbi:MULTISPECIES: hypothetical protein [unclassified Nostoc]|nr:hypothetical protein [Nostoc sp. ChiQUE02]